MNAAILGELTGILGAENVSTSPGDLAQASRDESDLEPKAPDVVVWGESTEDVIGVVEACRKYRTPLTVRGAGTSLEGNPIPIKGGVVLDLSRMKRVLSVEPEHLLAVCEPGVVYNDLNDKLAQYGLFFPTSPGGSADIATIGGMVANNASGIFALKYGATRRHIRGLVAVTGAGEVIRTGHRCPKSSAGYDLTSLLCGSEGTLAIVTEITLGLCGRPGALERMGFQFSSDGDCAQAIAALISGGVDLAACEYLDTRCIRALNKFKSYGLPETPMLFLEVHGVGTQAIEETVATAGEVCREFGGQQLQLDSDPWEVRHWATRAIRAVHPGTITVRCDVAFPIGALPQIVAKSHTLASAYDLNLYGFGHVGLGILHILIQVDPNNLALWDDAMEVKDLIVAEVVDMGGTCSGEHGVGLGNKRYMRREHGMAVEVMRRIKTAFDPEGILNPGKVLP